MINNIFKVELIYVQRHKLLVWSKPIQGSPKILFQNHGLPNHELCCVSKFYTNESSTMNCKVHFSFVETSTSALPKAIATQIWIRPVTALIHLSKMIRLCYYITNHDLSQRNRTPKELFGLYRASPFWIIMTYKRCSFSITPDIGYSIFKRVTHYQLPNVIHKVIRKPVYMY